MDAHVNVVEDKNTISENKFLTFMQKEQALVVPI